MSEFRLELQDRKKVVMQHEMPSCDTTMDAMCSPPSKNYDREAATARQLAAYRRKNQELELRVLGHHVAYDRVISHAAADSDYRIQESERLMKRYDELLRQCNELAAANCDLAAQVSALKRLAAKRRRG